MAEPEPLPEWEREFLEKQFLEKQATLPKPGWYSFRVLLVPHSIDIDGAVVELHSSESGNLVTMDIRIPAHQ